MAPPLEGGIFSPTLGSGAGFPEFSYINDSLKLHFYRKE